MAVDVIEELQQNKVIQISPQGYSMYPLIVPGRDEMVIEPAKLDNIKRGDIALYRGFDGRLTVHRLHHKDADGGYFVGDNMYDIEPVVVPELVYGRVIEIIRKGKSIPANNGFYKVFTGLWLLMLPVRRPVMSFLKKIKR